MIALRRNKHWRRLWRRHLIVATLEEPSDRGRLATPRDVTCHWNKGPAIWFPWCAGKLQSLINSRSGPARHIFRYWTLPIEAVAPQDQIWEDARLDPREGDERLSAKKRTESDGSAHSQRSRKSNMPQKNVRKPRPSDLGRALRSIYDDTLREPIPDDFVNLIGKLR